MPSTSWLLRDMGFWQVVRGRGGSSGARNSEEASPETAPLSDGEIHFLWWFIQGAIMEVETRWKLRRAWGLCGRHAWGALATEAAFRHSYLHGPAVLYVDLMERALCAFQVRGALQARRLSRRLRATRPCLMCELHLARKSRAAARAELIEQGRDPSQLESFAAGTRRFWWKTVCGRCVGNGSPARCRPHLVEEISRGAVRDLARHRALVKYILEHHRVYKQSFVWGYRGTDTQEDRAALISAVGWCSGWRPWIGRLTSTGP